MRKRLGLVHVLGLGTVLIRKTLLVHSVSYSARIESKLLAGRVAVLD